MLTQLERKTHGWGDTHGGFLLKARLTQGALWPERDVGVFAILKYRGAALRGSRCCTGYSLLAGRWHQDGQASLALISFQLRGTPSEGEESLSSREWSHSALAGLMAKYVVALMGLSVPRTA